ncbi:hypothetical protein [Pseudomonas serbica]|uniref:hypothetical protein n=1 Tax=Pseudomonas serbica TaxID=2965074 RepID=UPI00237B9F8A|nr:hypothetical protein [Pseudomonas serbica]
MNDDHPSKKDQAVAPLVFHGTKNEEVDFTASKNYGSEGAYFASGSVNPDPGQHSGINTERVVVLDGAAYAAAEVAKWNAMGIEVDGDFTPPTGPNPFAQYGAKRDVTPAPGEDTATPMQSQGNPVTGDLIAKDDWMQTFDPMVLEFLKEPALSSYRPDIEGVLVDEDEKYKHLPKGIADSMKPVPIKVSLEDWLELKDKSPAGVDPVLGDFLRANPAYFDPNRSEGEGVTLRQLGVLSDNLTRLNMDKPMIQQGSEWIAPKLVLHNYLGEKIMNELIDFAKAKGINVKGGLGLYQQLDLDDSPRP